LSGCSSLGRQAPSRLKATQKTSCLGLVKNLKERENLYQALRGRLSLENKNQRYLADTFLIAPHYLRMLFSNPLGVKIALFQIDAEWVQMFIPRMNRVYRIPKEILQKNSLRRERFLEILPFYIPVDIIVEVLLTRVAISRYPSKAMTCYKAADSKIPSRLKSTLSGQKIDALFDLQSWAPLSLRLGAEKSQGQDLLISFKHFDKEGLSALPRVIRLSRAKKQQLSLKWLEAELIDSDLSTFNSWRPPAGADIIDY